MKRKSRFEVEARQHHLSSTWNVEVVAETEHEAKVLGINALVELGLVNKQHIKSTKTRKIGDDVWVGA